VTAETRPVTNPDMTVEEIGIEAEKLAAEIEKVTQCKAESGESIRQAYQRLKRLREG